MFRLVNFFIRNFTTHYGYVKLSLESQKTFSVNEIINQGLKIIEQQLRAIFVDFKNCCSEEAKSQFQLPKKAFVTLRQDSFFMS